MAAWGLDHRAAAVARLYTGLIDGFVLDEHDAAEAAEIETLGLRVLTGDTLAPPAARRHFAAAVINFGRSLAAS
jgi:hypothetical protein